VERWARELVELQRQGSTVFRLDGRQSTGRQASAPRDATRRRRRIAVTPTPDTLSTAHPPKALRRHELPHPRSVRRPFVPPATAHTNAPADACTGAL
jgi:hypothetical protein